MKKGNVVYLAAGLAAALLVFGLSWANAQQTEKSSAPQAITSPPQAANQGDQTRGGDRGPGGDRGGRGDRGGFDPARIREMMAERVRESINVSDEEWKAIKPLAEDVMEKQFATRSSMRFGGMRGPRGGDDRSGPGRGDRGGMFGQPNPAADALEKAIESKNAEEIKAKLAALRADRKAKEDALKQSRDKLRAVLTPAQEAALVLQGILD